MNIIALFHTFWVLLTRKFQTLKQGRGNYSSFKSENGAKKHFVEYTVNKFNAVLSLSK